MKVPYVTCESNEKTRMWTVTAHAGKGTGAVRFSTSVGYELGVIGMSAAINQCLQTVAMASAGGGVTGPPVVALESVDFAAGDAYSAPTLQLGLKLLGGVHVASSSQLVAKLEAALNVALAESGVLAGGGSAGGGAGGSSFGSSSAVLNILRATFPALETTSERCPVVGEPCGKSPWKLVALVPHLNDAHSWTFEQIADWLDSLDVDLSEGGKPTTEQLAQLTHKSPQPPLLKYGQPGFGKTLIALTTQTAKTYDDFYKKYLAGLPPDSVVFGDSVLAKEAGLKELEMQLLGAGGEEKAAVDEDEEEEGVA